MRGKYSPTVSYSYSVDKDWHKKYANCEVYDPAGYDSYGYNKEGIDRANLTEYNYDSFDYDFDYDSGEQIYWQIESEFSKVFCPDWDKEKEEGRGFNFI